MGRGERRPAKLTAGAARSSWRTFRRWPIADFEDRRARYCATCGAEHSPNTRFCGNCGASWDPGGLADTPEAIAGLLDAIDIWRADGLLDAISFARLRTHYERRRAELLPPPADEPVAASEPEDAAAPEAPPGVPEPREPRPPLVPTDPPPRSLPPRRPPVQIIGEWAARRQADVLLYLGAFLLVVSALIFTSSRDEALSGGWRVAILAVYTAAFLAAGLLLRRWPRVREAGPAFLAIGALLMPLNFLLLHNEVLGDREVSGELVWFAASSYSMAFYGFLAARGLGRLYVIPAAIALLNAWGSLPIVLGLPIEWFGAWWMGFALAGTLALSATRRWRVATAAPVVVIAALSLVFAHLMAAFEPSTEHRWHLPATYALLTAIVAVAGWYARQPLVLLAVTVLAVSTALAGVWASELSPQWFSAPPLVAAAVLLLSRPQWQSWSPQLAHSAWLLAVAGVLAPFVLADTHLQGDRWGAAAAFLAAGALAAAIAWRQQQRRHLRFGLESTLHHSPAGARGVRVARVRIAVDRHGLRAGSARAGQPAYRLGLRRGCRCWVGVARRRRPPQTRVAVGDPARAAPRDRRLDSVSRRSLCGS